MDDRSCKVPNALDKFFGLNNPKLRKQKVPPVESQKLLEHATNIDTLLELPFVNSERWKAVKILLTELADALHKYLRYLQKQRYLKKLNCCNSSNHTLQVYMAVNVN